MTHKEHAEACVKEFGKPFEEIHVFLDQFWPKYKISHRRLLHHWLGLELIVNRFGKEARAPAELHIFQDLGRVPKSWLDHDPFTVYLDNGDEEKQEADLILLYGQQKYNALASQGKEARAKARAFAEHLAAAAGQPLASHGGERYKIHIPNRGWFEVSPHDGKVWYQGELTQEQALKIAPSSS